MASSEIDPRVVTAPPGLHLHVLQICILANILKYISAQSIAGKGATQVEAAPRTPLEPSIPSPTRSAPWQTGC